MTLKIAHDITDLLAPLSYSHKVRISSSSLITVWIPHGKKKKKTIKNPHNFLSFVGTFAELTLKQFDENKILRIDNTDLNTNGSTEVLI